LTIKLFRVNVNPTNAQVKAIVIGFNNKTNGRYIERLGVFYKEHGVDFVLLNIPRFAYWVHKGVRIKPKVSWALGILAQGEIGVSNKKNDKL